VILAVICFAFAFVSAFDVEKELQGFEYLPRFLPANVSGHPYCATEDIWKWKKAVRSGFASQESLNCAVEGDCDLPQVRNTWRGRTNQISLFITVICANDSNCPVSRVQVEEQLLQINRDFAGTNFSFVIAEVAFRVDAQYAELDAFSQFLPFWYFQLINLKNKYAQSPDKYLNFYITKQKPGSQGTLLGIGTFPWDPESKTEFGGLWMNANYIGLGQKTLSHEIGHNIGLWHAFHGINEVGCNTDCYEPVHNETDEFSAPNTYGDFCADTLSQPMNYNCAPPATRDCRGTLYTNINSNLIPELTNNIMAYTPDTCMQKFTQQQSWRGYCWVCKEFPRWTPFCPSIPFETK
jgi:hypothetical protein